MAVQFAIEIAFDPVLRLGDAELRWQTVGVSVALLVALAIAARIGGHLPGAPPLLERRAPHRPVRRYMIGAPYPPAPVIEQGEVARVEPLRLEDLVFICLGVVPGAFVGGRVVHGLVFPDAYLYQPQLLLDPATGSLSLLGAVVGGALSGAYICRLLGAPLRRWADAAAVPMILALGLGKIAQLLGGSGQGAPFNGPWAVAFVGEGPWIGMDARLPAHPSQVYEGLWLLLGIPVILAVAGPGRELGRWLGRLRRLAGPDRPDGQLLLAALCWFLLGRVAVGFTWRDERLVGPLNGEQVVALVVLAAIALSGAAIRRARRETWRDGRPAPAGYGDIAQRDR
jgi:prolipoprotein diacylglyceryltransferase